MLNIVGFNIIRTQFYKQFWINFFKTCYIFRVYYWQDCFFPLFKWKLEKVDRHSKVRAKYCIKCYLKTTHPGKKITGARWKNTIYLKQILLKCESCDNLSCFKLFFWSYQRIILSNLRRFHCIQRRKTWKIIPSLSVLYNSQNF